MLVIERLGIESNIALQTVDTMEIFTKPNQHVKMVLGGILNTDNDALNSNWEGQEIQIVELADSNSVKEVLFTGVIENTYVYVENNLSQIIVTALSSTAMLDKGKKCHSYQDIKKSFDQLIRETVENIGGSVAFYHSENKPIQKPIIQYEETDWQFCNRMASHLGLPIYSNPMQREVNLQIGVDIGTNPVMEIGEEYQVFAQSGALNFQRGIGYEVKSYENYRIGDLVKTPSGDMYICEKTATFQKGELQFIYKLCYFKDMHTDVVYNTKIAGMMLEGEVANVKEESVFVKFDIDAGKGEALYPYPWTPLSGNIMYCMPERGARVGVYFNCGDEREACAIVNLHAKEKYVTSEKRILETKYGKKMQLYPGLLSLNAEPMPTKKLALELIDEEGIQLQSHNALTMHSRETILFVAPNITVKTPTELHTSRTFLGNMEKSSGSRNPATGGDNVDTVFTMGQEFNLLSEQGVLWGTEHIQYADFNDDIKELAIPKSKFSIGKLVGSVIAGLVVVAAVAAIAAYAASVVFTGGAMAAAAPFIVGGIAAMVGTAAVMAKAVSDYDNQTNSSLWEYLGAAALGTTAGAVAGFAIVAAPYTAQFLTQQSMLALPSILVNPLTYNIISGGSTLLTGGITFANLIFTQFNVIEAVSGENALKSWMISCDEENGETTYNVLSSVSFLPPWELCSWE